MRILVTNDDGVHSPGLWALVEALSDLGHVSVVAPDRDMSGVGTAMTLLNVVRVQEITSPVEGVEAVAVQGTPSDCVILATGALFSEPFDLVVSGINSGSNLGLDVWSSGTVGGALRGYMQDIPSMAVSVVYGKDAEVRYAGAARVARALARGLSDGAVNGPPVLNVNVPDVDADGIEGVEVTRLGAKAYLYKSDRVEEGRRHHYRIRYSGPAVEDPIDGTDIWAVRNNLVSITPIDLGLTTDAPEPWLLGLVDEVRSALGLVEGG